MQSEELKRSLKEIAEILNQFKSEAVQLKVLEVLIDKLDRQEVSAKGSDRELPSRAQRQSYKRTSDAATVKLTSPKSASRTPGGGAYSVITRFLEEGFFNKPESISTITKHASERLGHRLKANECSPALLRLLRSGRLTRSKNSDGQYEYKKA